MEKDEMVGLGNKMWVDLTDSEKIDRTREQVKWMLDRICRVEERLERLYGHKHDGEKLVQELKYWENTNGGCVSSIGGHF